MQEDFLSIIFIKNHSVILYQKRKLVWVKYDYSLKDTHREKAP